MKHLGDITKIHGDHIEPVNVITFGSPCQDLSVANGDRQGLGGERSGLFMEAVRIIKEMRRATNGILPAFVVWENVPGAFSSPKGSPGEDFRVVLEELARIREESASIPRPEGGWRPTGCIMGDGWSIAWRVFDSQFWGVPQRRRRISLVVDFGGQRAPEVLFERSGLRGNSAQGGKTREGIAGAAENGLEAAGFNGWRSITGSIEYQQEKAPCIQSTMPPNVVYGFSAGQGAKAGGIGYAPETAPTIRAASSGTNQVPCVICDPDVVGTLTARHDGNPYPDRSSQTVVTIPINDQATHEGGGCNGIMVGEDGDPMYSLTARDRHSVLCMATGQGGAEIIQGVSPTLSCNHEQPVLAVDCFHGKVSDCSNTITAHESGGISVNAINPVMVNFVVRRLTPLECERLQGYPDGWTDIPDYINSKGKRKSASDAARYKALGNSISIPNWKWVLKRITTFFYRDATLGSLFDGIGGFPYIWEQLNGRNTARWASEIEEFPIAVTKYRLGEA